MDEIMVSICCITYNQAEYLRQCLDGFINQNLSYSYEIIISNDCSSDNTQDIINEYKSRYKDIILDISPKQNLGMMKNFYHTLKSCRGKYIAYCEGDDYWIDNNKLQMQIDYLEKNLNYGMCYTSRKNYLQSKNEFMEFSKFDYNCVGRNIVDVYDLLNNVNPIGTLTVCMRSNLLFKYLDEIKPEDKNWLLGDYPIWLWFAINSKIGYLPVETSVYRVLNESASHSKDITKEINFRKSVWSVKYFFSQKYDLKIEKWNVSLYEYSMYYKNCCDSYNKDNVILLKRAYNALNKEDKSIDKRILIHLVDCFPMFYIVRKIFGFFRKIGVK